MESEQLIFPSLELPNSHQPPIDLDALASRIGNQARPIEYPETATEKWQNEVGGTLHYGSGREYLGYCRQMLTQSEQPK